MCTRPNITYALANVSHYMRNLGKEHWAIVKWLLKYLRGTLSVCIEFVLGKYVLERFIDSDMSVDANSSRSTSGYVMTFARGALSWQSRLQNIVALSITQAKYMDVVETDKDIIWMGEFIGELGMKQDQFLLHCDNQSAIHLGKDVAYHSQNKHIQRRYH